MEEKFNEQTALQEVETQTPVNNAENVVDSYDDSYEYELDNKVGAAFGRGMAAAVLAWFPVTSFLAILLGLSAGKLANKTVVKSRRAGIKVSRRLSAAKALGKVGWIGGLLCSCIYILCFLFFAAIYELIASYV